MHTALLISPHHAHRVSARLPADAHRTTYCTPTMHTVSALDAYRTTSSCTPCWSHAGYGTRACAHGLRGAAHGLRARAHAAAHTDYEQLHTDCTRTTRRCTRGCTRTMRSSTRTAHGPAPQTSSWPSSCPPPPAPERSPRVSFASDHDDEEEEARG
eukprot:2338837-Rhodomonas_salina.1